jgi:hypothetical protein
MNIHTIAAKQAFNIICHDSVLIFQFGGTQNLPIACRVTNTSPESMKNAYTTIMDNYPPDDKKIAVIICFSSLEVSVVEKELSKVDVKELFICDGDELISKYPFIETFSLECTFRYYPNAILDYLYLGSACSLTDDVALNDLGMSAI